ncbi:MAG: glycosyltransferase family 39 protein, partial [Planctomycetota bacterium]
MDEQTQRPGRSGPISRIGTPSWFLIIVGLALLVRLIHLAQLSENPFFQHPTMDAKVHHEWAQEFAEGKEWSIDRRSGEPVPYFRAPLYIWFLGTIYSVFGVDAGLAPRLIQCLLGALSCGLVFLLGTRLFGRGVGILAGGCMSVYWTAVYFDGELLIVPLQIFLNLLLLLMLVVAGERRTWWAFATAGLLLGLEAIARPNILLFAPAVCVWILWLERAKGGGLRRGIVSCLAFGLALLMPIAPITIRNSVIGHDEVLISSQGGVNFYIGNNPQTDGVTAIVPGTPPDWWGGFYATREMAAQALGREPKPSEVSRYFFHKAFQFWREDTSRAIDRTVRKIRLFLYGMEYPNNQCIYSFTELFTPFTRWLPGCFWIVGPFGMLGFFLALFRGLKLFPLWGFVLVYSVSIVMFFVSARFRMPVVFPLSILAAHAFFWLILKAKERAFLKLAAGGLALAAFAHLTLYFPDRSAYGFVQKNEGETLWRVGVELAERHEDEEALLYLTRAAKSLEETARTAVNQERGGSAIRLLCQGLAYEGEVLERLGRLDSAVDAYKS